VFLFFPSPLLSLVQQAAIEAKMQMWLKAAEEKKRAEGVFITAVPIQGCSRRRHIGLSPGLREDS
jgi:hypothetical protein